MASFNKVILIGNLTRDPEVRYTPKGTAVAQCGLAVNRKWKTEQGEEKEEVTFVDFDCFGRIAENFAQYMRKGGSILLEGRLKLDQWDDRDTGAKRSKLKIIAEGITFLAAKRDGGADDGPSAPAPAARPNPTKPKEDLSDGPPEDDDVPF